jgi:steroid delta-isomerase-like uncharacterized protein
MSEQNKTLVRRAVEEVWNRGNYAVVNELVASDIVVHASTPDGEIHGPEGVKQFYATLRRAFPDIHFTIEDQIAEGDRVVTRWTARGTHRGEFNGIPPTGKQGAISGIDIDRIADGKVVECWPNADELDLLQQLGVIPVPNQPV